MEYILMAIFDDGGILDWNMLEKTNYDWYEIMDNIIGNYGTDLRSIGVNTFINTIFDMAISDFQEAVNNFIEENKYNEDLKNKIQILEDIDFSSYDNWNTYTNYIDNSIDLVVKNKEIIDIINKYLKDEIEEINDNIGFTEINIIEE